jgi:hypothetical protein
MEEGYPAAAEEAPATNLGEYGTTLLEETPATGVFDTGPLRSWDHRSEHLELVVDNMVVEEAPTTKLGKYETTLLEETPATGVFDTGSSRSWENRRGHLELVVDNTVTDSRKITREWLRGLSKEDKIIGYITSIMDGSFNVEGAPAHYKKAARRIQSDAWRSIEGITYLSTLHDIAAYHTDKSPGVEMLAQYGVTQETEENTPIPKARPFVSWLQKAKRMKGDMGRLFQPNPEGSYGQQADIERDPYQEHLKEAQCLQALYTRNN